MRIFEVAMSGTIGTRNMGPVSNDILQLSNRFVARGHEVVIFDVPCQEPRELLHPAVRLVEVPGVNENRFVASSLKHKRLLAILRSWHNYCRIVGRIASYLNRSHGVKFAHFHSPAPLWIAQKIYRMETFYTSHTPVWSLEAEASKSLVARFNAWVERQAIRGARLTVALGDYLALAVPDADIRTIPNGIAVNEWNVIDRTSARRALGIDERAFVVLFVGRMDRVKGVDTLLDALKSLTPSLPNLRAFMIGSLSGAFATRDDHVDPYTQQLLDTARCLPVKFLGFISNRTIEFRQYLAAADVTVVPSRHEPQGNVVLESLVMGTPVIGSDTGGIPDMVSADVGYLFPPGDVGALVARIKHVHDHPNELIAKGSLARRRVVERYSWDDVADRYLAEFRKRTPSQSTR